MKLQAAAKYRSRAGWLPYAELAFGTYFLVMMAYAVETLKLSCAAISCDFRLRILLGGFRKLVAGSAGPSAVAASAEAGTRSVYRRRHVNAFRQTGHLRCRCCGHYPAYRPSPALLEVVSGLSREFAHIVVVNDGSGPEYSHVFDEVARISGVHVCAMNRIEARDRR